MSISVANSLRQCRPDKLAARVKEYLDAGQCSPETVRAALAEMPKSDHVAKAMELVAEKPE